MKLTFEKVESDGRKFYFSDGCGTISQDRMQQICTHLKLSQPVVSAVQVWWHWPLILVRSFMRSPHTDVRELPKQDANVLTHTDFLPSIRKRAQPVLVILIHPNADYAGKNVLLTLFNLCEHRYVLEGSKGYIPWTPNCPKIN